MDPRLRGDDNLLVSSPSAYKTASLRRGSYFFAGGGLAAALGAAAAGAGAHATAEARMVGAIRMIVIRFST
jgi:hypothetical protein